MVHARYWVVTGSRVALNRRENEAIFEVAWRDKRPLRGQESHRGKLYFNRGILRSPRPKLIIGINISRDHNLPYLAA